LAESTSQHTLLHTPQLKVFCTNTPNPLLHSARSNHRNTPFALTYDLTARSLTQYTNIFQLTPRSHIAAFHFSTGTSVASKQADDATQLVLTVDTPQHHRCKEYSNQEALCKAAALFTALLLFQPESTAGEKHSALFYCSTGPLWWMKPEASLQASQIKCFPIYIGCLIRVN
jgi:hypothetical protein